MYLPQEGKPKTNDYHRLVPVSGLTLNPFGYQWKLGLEKDYTTSDCGRKKAICSPASHRVSGMYSDRNKTILPRPVQIEPCLHQQ